MLILTLGRDWVNITSKQHPPSGNTSQKEGPVKSPDWLQETMDIKRKNQEAIHIRHQCLTLNRDRDYELPTVFNFSFSCVKIHISGMSILRLAFAEEDLRYIWKLQCFDIMGPFWLKVVCFCGLTLHCWWRRHMDISWNYLIQNHEDVLRRAISNARHY